MFSQPPDTDKEPSSSQKSNKITSTEQLLTEFRKSGDDLHALIQSGHWQDLPFVISSWTGGEEEVKICEFLNELMRILDTLYDKSLRISNKRLLHSALMKLAQSSLFGHKVKRGVQYCLTSLEFVEDGQVILLDHEEFNRLMQMKPELEELQKKVKKMSAKQSETDQKIAKLEQIVAKHEETLNPPAPKVDPKPDGILASEVIVSFITDHFRLSGLTVTKINATNWASCFTKPISQEIHRLTIRVNPSNVGMAFGISTLSVIGVIAAADYPSFLTTYFYASGKAATVYTSNGVIYTGSSSPATNKLVGTVQLFSVEANLEKKTLHFFYDGVQQPNHFVGIPVPLVFGISSYNQNHLVDITFWGEVKQPSVTYEGTGHNLKG
ncbi:hypothetical protein BLNAU_3136 [Blattamonas nauphoetae]|uniref:TLDc domain-containing protein n=1 Tax=Blattamonas nauphoetae TaxID=2049346 RepID=A0ABQ9YDN1_9EUKA|nr:hypothetical protein BLNAU_3136 [Blattamonas nauphoetae]